MLRHTLLRDKRVRNSSQHDAIEVFVSNACGKSQIKNSAGGEELVYVDPPIASF